MPGGLDEHVTLGVNADRFGDIASQWDGQLAAAAAQVEQATGAIEPEPLDDVVDDDAGKPRRYRE